MRRRSTGSSAPWPRRAAFACSPASCWTSTLTGPSWRPAWTTCGPAAPRSAELDRLSRSLAGLIGIVGTLCRHGAGFKSLHEALSTTPGGRLVFHVFALIG
jgi:hypothetical protein